MKYSWWFGTAHHLWRTYFALTPASPDTIPDPTDRYVFALCHNIYTGLSERDKLILRTYFSARWGNASYAVEELSAETGIKPNTIYAVVNRNGAAVMTALGIMKPNRKE